MEWNLWPFKFFYFETCQLDTICYKHFNPWGESSKHFLHDISDIIEHYMTDPR